MKRKIRETIQSCEVGEMRKGKRQRTQRIGAQSSEVMLRKKKIQKKEEQSSK